MATSEVNNLDHHYDSKYKSHCSTCRDFYNAEENGKSITEASRDYEHPFMKIRSSLPKPKSKSNGGKRRKTFRKTKRKRITSKTRRTKKRHY